MCDGKLDLSDLADKLKQTESLNNDDEDKN